MRRKPLALTIDDDVRALEEAFERLLPHVADEDAREEGERALVTFRRAWLAEETRRAL